MRDITNWSKQLRQKLRNCDDLKSHVTSNLPDDDRKVHNREIQRIAQLILEVELWLTLLKEVAPEASANSVSALLSGYRFPVAFLQSDISIKDISIKKDINLQSDINWLMVQKARFYLVRRKGNQWERSLSEYINIPEILRIYSLTEINQVPQLIPSSTYPRRQQLYHQTLSATPDRCRFFTRGSIKSIKPGENKGDSTKHVAAGKTSMLKNKLLLDWSCIVSKQMAHLSIPQAIGLATWSFGVVMTKSSSLTQVSQLIADINEEKPNTVRQRLKEWYQEAPAKKGLHRRDFDVSSCFAPLLLWVLSLLPKNVEDIAKALDATSIGDKFTVLSMNILLGGSGIPIAGVYCQSHRARKLETSAAKTDFSGSRCDSH